MAGGHRSKDALHRTRLSLGERLLRIFNSKLRDEFLNGEIFYSLKEAAGAGGTLARPLQHRQATLFAGLQTTSTGSLADRNNTGHGKVESQQRFPLLHTPDGDGITTKPAALH